MHSANLPSSVRPGGREAQPPIQTITLISIG
jgi:hypothetical protein